MKKRGQFKSKKYPSENTYYYRVMKCGACDGSMHARQQKKNGVTYITYVCNNRLNGTCTEPGFSHSKIQENYMKQQKKLLLFCVLKQNDCLLLIKMLVYIAISEKQYLYLGCFFLYKE